MVIVCRVILEGIVNHAQISLFSTIFILGKTDVEDIYYDIITFTPDENMVDC